MSDAEDIDALAGEYVLGTLDPGERATVAMPSRPEPAWRTPSRPGSAGSHRSPRRSRRKTSQHTCGRSSRRALPRCRAPPRSSSWSAGSTGGAQPPWLRARSQPRSFFSSATLPGPSRRNRSSPCLQKDAQSPAFLVSVDLEKKLLTIRAVAAEQQPGKSYELWLVHDNLKTPRSLGVIGDKPFTIVHPTLAAYSPQVIDRRRSPSASSPRAAPRRVRRPARCCSPAS